MSSHHSKALSGVAADVLAIEGMDSSVVEPFLDESFRHVEYASTILQDPRTSSSARVQELFNSLNKLDGVIASEVMAKQDRLLAHVGQLQSAETAMRQIHNAVRSLSSKVSGLKADVSEPFEALQGHAAQLGNLHTAVHLLRLVSFRLKQGEKLRAALVEDIDAAGLAKAAKIVQEAETVAPMASVAGIATADKCAVAAARRGISMALA
jgi:Golgi transport complex subunit 5